MGNSRILWRNPSTDTIHQLQFHTYLNAFKNTASTLLRETHGNVFGKQLQPDMPEKEWGYVEVHQMKTAAGEDLSAGMHYIQPDDSNAHDQTVLAVDLPQPVLPGEEIELELSFTSKLPRILVRTGWSLDHYYLAVQWFPKLGVYEPQGVRYAPQGRWNCHQYHRSAEYYADFGVYDVAINVPQNLTVGASGICWDSLPQPDGSITYRYRAEDVIDFAWTASPRFVEVKDQWQHVSIRLLMQPEHLNQKERYLKAVKHAFAFFDTTIAPYPYPNLTIVDPPMHGLRSGAMEYPTLITASTFHYLSDGLHLTEALTVHEFCHQYFMQMVASNEMEEPWLDEGLTSYFEERIMDAVYGPQHANIDLPGFHIGDHEASRDSYTSMPNPRIGSISQLPWELPEGVAHTLNYFKASAALYTLEGLLGRPVMDSIFRTYFHRWKFRHPHSRDFVAVAAEVAERELGHDLRLDIPFFFEQVLQGTEVCDYQLAAITNHELQPPFGLQAPTLPPPGQYESRIRIERPGGMVLPQEVMLYFENDSSQLIRWDGKDRFKEIVICGNQRVLAAHIDPFYKIHLDLNYLNNSLSLQERSWPLRKYALKLLWWLQQLMLIFGGCL